MRPGPVGAPRRRLNPSFRDRVRGHGRPLWLLALQAGFPQQANLSGKLHAPFIPATALVVGRLERLADAVGFPRDHIFIDEHVEAGVEA